MNPKHTAVFRQPPTEKQKAYIRELAMRLKMDVNLDKVTDREHASRAIRTLALLAGTDEEEGGSPPFPLEPWLDRIVQADCTQALQRLPTGSIDLAVTDPPHLVRYRSRDGRAIANDSPQDEGVIQTAMAETFRVLKPDTFCVCFYGWSRIEEFARAWRRAGFRIVGHFVWTKNYASGSGTTRRRHEQAYLLAKGRAKPDWEIFAKRSSTSKKPWIISISRKITIRRLNQKIGGTARFSGASSLLRSGGRFQGNAEERTSPIGCS